jgi:hypothetical protein
VSAEVSLEIIPIPKQLATIWKRGKTTNTTKLKINISLINFTLAGSLKCRGSSNTIQNKESMKEVKLEGDSSPDQ